jgi:hypothetical protein
VNLLELQRRMAHDVRRPLTADYQMQRAAEDGSSMEATAASYIAPNAVLSSFERLEIYNRQYWFRVIGAVSEDFPALQAVLGDKRFDALILAYLRERPSTSWTLRDLGAKFPDFLSKHPEFSGRQYHLAVDVANLEWAYVEAFDGPGLTPLCSEDLRILEPNSKLSLQPHLRLLALDYPVDELVLAVRQETPESEIVSSAVSERSSKKRAKLPPMRRRKLYLAVHRLEGVVYYRAIDHEAYLLLEALRDGASIEAAIGKAFERSKLSEKKQASRMQLYFAHATELGWICPWRGEQAATSELVM